MALRDYITCSECESKLICDGYDSIRDELERQFGDEDADEWTITVLCTKCSGDGSLKFIPQKVEHAQPGGVSHWAGMFEGVPAIALSFWGGASLMMFVDGRWTKRKYKSLAELFEQTGIQQQ